SPIDQENNPKLEESFRIKVWNQPGGTIEVSSDQGKNWLTVGSVIYPSIKTNPEGYTASRWVDDGRVAATAVNAIHIKTATKKGGGVVFSLLPKEFLVKQKDYNSYLSPTSSIYTDIPAGESIFGGGYAPFVGNKLLLARPGYTVGTLPAGYVPAVGDKIYIIVERPVAYPKEIVFENRFGGKITIKYRSGGEKVIGEVLRPVVGVGRFDGTRYASAGRIRADHAGVIDVSTSRFGRIGGFQIVPSLHGSNMKAARELTQWMVIGPAEGSDEAYEGKAPFFKYFIRPAYYSGDFAEDDWEKKVMARFLVDAKVKGSDQWQPLPIYEFSEYELTGDVPAWASDALLNITYLRILFPVYE
ncbi:MAG: hypothetical protein PHH14_06245, partial [Candidatus Margulisbacteria bacterium]|nr:hypothetical protein [Candidatus Margulisiibacteriota bacterium]